MSNKTDFISEYRTTNKEKISGTKAFICPNCKAANPIEFKAKIKIFNEDDVFPDLHLSIVCNNCGNRFNQSVDNAIDPEMAYAVLELNSKGYRTEFSCQGHIYKDGSKASAYIKFANIIPKEAFKELPEPVWELEEEYDCSVIRCSKLNCDNRIELLNNWVDSLPTISEIIYKEVVNSTDIDQCNMTCVNNTDDQYLRIKKSSR